MGQQSRKHGDAVASVQIIFTAEELEVLRERAERARAELMAEGIHPRRVLEEVIYEFARDWSGGHRWLTPAALGMARRIKNEMRMRGDDHQDRARR